MPVNGLYPHQERMASEVESMLRAQGVAYLAAEPRTGKTRAAIQVVRNLPVENALFITKKAAISGVVRELQAFPAGKDVVVTNYEQAHKLDLSTKSWLVIVDEAHAVGTPGKPSQRFKTLRRLCQGKPVLLMSGTPLTESPLAAYYQFGVCSFTPFKHRTFYDFFREFGTPNPISVNNRLVETYKTAKPSLLPEIDKHLVKVSQTDAGIEFQAEDEVHRVTLDEGSLGLINTLRHESIATLPDGTTIVCENEASLRTVCHQLEAGAVLLEGRIVMTPSTAVVDYLRERFGDNPQTAVMCHYHSTAAKVRAHLPRVRVFSSEADCAGTDLSQFKHFVVLNTGYSGISHVQRRERGTRLDAQTRRVVNHIVCEGQLSERVYRQVSKKLSFNLRHLREWRAAR